jgi:hypothetical protein
MGKTLIFRCEGINHPVAVDDSRAPRTVAALEAWLPAEITIHCAKIAGCHIYWPTPILELLEGSSDIHSLPPGAFLYYPDRQYLEITYDALQAETAAVNPLGIFEGDIGWLRDFADRQRKAHGQRIFTASLFFQGQESVRPAKPIPDGTPYERLCRARAAVWKKMPAELESFLARDGLNIPFGPTITAEGEFRRTQELIWRLWRNSHGHDESVLRAIAREALDLMLARVVGYCHLHEAGRVLEEAQAALSDTAVPAKSVLGELTLYCGSMAGWLDLQVPWWEANQIMRRNQGRV